MGNGFTTELKAYKAKGSVRATLPAMMLTAIANAEQHALLEDGEVPAMLIECDMANRQLKITFAEDDDGEE